MEKMHLAIFDIGNEAEQSVATGSEPEREPHTLTFVNSGAAPDNSRSRGTGTTLLGPPLDRFDGLSRRKSDELDVVVLRTGILERDKGRACPQLAKDVEFIIFRADHD